MNKKDAVIAAGLCLFGIAACIKAFEYPQGTRMFPAAYAMLLAFFSSLLFIKSFFFSAANGANQAGEKIEEGIEGNEPYSKVLMVVLIVLGYVILIPNLGFYSSTACFLFLTTGVTKAARLLTALAVSVVTTGILYAFFDFFLRVPAPRGFWI